MSPGARTKCLPGLRPAGRRTMSHVHCRLAARNWPLKKTGNKGVVETGPRKLSATTRSENVGTVVGRGAPCSR